MQLGPVVLATHLFFTMCHYQKCTKCTPLFVLLTFVSQSLHLLKFLLLLLLLWVRRVLLCDFGCARHWETKQVPEKRLGRFNTFAGTPAYMSPQVCGCVCVFVCL